MRGYLEDLKAGGRPMTDKELADHYKHLYSEVKKQKDDVVEYIKENACYDETNVCCCYLRYDECLKVLRMLGETDVED